MPVTHPRFVHCPQLQAASLDKPPLKKGASGEGVRLVQEALRDLGNPLPISTLPDGQLDGLYGNETKDLVSLFQQKNGLSYDGEVGKNTLAKLEQKLRELALPPKVEDHLPYTVSGNVRRLLQRELIHPHNLSRSTDQLCWAAAVTTMQSWRDKKNYPTLEVIEGLGSFFARAYEFGHGMHPDAYRLLLQRAGMQALPPQTLPTSWEWYQLLRQHGLLWVGAMSDTSGDRYRHSFIIQGMFVAEEFGTRFKMQQPGSTREWNLSVSNFTGMVQEAAEPGYLQVRYYPNRGR